MTALTVSSGKNELKRIMNFIEMGLEVYGCYGLAWLEITEMVEDIYSNIMRNAFPLEEGLIRVSINYIEIQRAVEVSFFDNGVPYNPLGGKLFGQQISGRRRQWESTAVAIMERAVDETSYVNLNRRNITTIKKYLE